jgi:hypothetical protein
VSFYKVKVVDMTGEVLATFDAGDGEDASVLEVVEELNKPGSARIRVPVHHPNAPDLVALVREVQVWRDGELAHWGPLAQRSYNAGAIEWMSPGVLWYLARRVFGPISINHLTNPLFATDLSSWTAVGATAAWSDAIRIRGAGTVRLEASSSGDFYLSQTFTVDTGPAGLFLALAAWFWLDPDVTFDAPPYESRGLYIAAVDSAEGEAYEPLTMDSPVGVPTRMETGIHILPDVTDAVVEVRLYCPWGAIHWGASSATELESVSSELTGTDITEMMRRIVDYAQNGAGKSDLNIATDTPASGITETVAYQFADLGGIFDTLATYPGRGLADFDVVLDGGDPDAEVGDGAGSRTFTTYAPRRGTHRADHALVVAGTQVLTLGHTLDGQQTSTRTIRRGQGDGSDRELGVATDTSALGGLVLEDVGDAPPEMSIDGLDRLAATDLARLRQIVSVPEVTVPAEGWWGVVRPGDTVPVTIDWGAVQEDATLRVQANRLNPATDTVSVTLVLPGEES